MTTAAALAIAPAIRPTSGNDRATPTDAGGDSFATVLDGEMDAVTENVPAAQPAPAPASVVLTKPVASGTVVEISAAIGAEGTFKAALANAASGVVADTTADQAIAASPTNPAPPVQTTQTAQAAAIAVLLAATSGAATSTSVGEAAPADGETTEGEATAIEDDASAVAPLAGLETTPAVPVVAAATGSLTTAAPTTEAVASTTSASPVGQAAPSLIAETEADVAAPAPVEADASATVDTQAKAPVANEKASAGANAPQAAAAAGAQAAVSADAVTPSANTSPPPPANAAAPAQVTVDAARTTTTPPALQSAPAATIQVYTRIIERADGRAQRFEVRLDPAELGRVDVRIEIGADRKVHAVLAAHDSAALSDLVRGQRALERALSGAGIDLADNGVRFELASDGGRGSAGQQQTNDGNGRSGQSNVWRNFDTVAIPVSEDAAVATVNNSWRPQRLDLVA